MGRSLAKPYVAARQLSEYCPTPWQCNTDQIIYEKQQTFADWRAGVIPHAVELVEYVADKFSAPSLCDDEVCMGVQRLLSQQL